MADLGQGVFVGRLTRDPELKHTQSGTTLVNFGIAYSMGYGDRKHPVFLDCTAFGKTAESLSKNTHKGTAVVLVAQVDQQHWTDQSGQKRSKHCLLVSSWQFGESRRDDNGQRQSSPSEQSPSDRDYSQYDDAPNADVPF